MKFSSCGPVPRLFGLLLAALALANCDPEAGLQPETREPSLLVDEFGPAPAKPVFPAGWPDPWPLDNPYSAEKAILGRRLFHDPRLSGDASVSCAWCHDSRQAFTNIHAGHLATGVGHLPILRSPPTLLNVGFLPALMNDGSAESLEAQVLFPLLAADEMNMPVPRALEVLRADSVYTRLFRMAFGPGDISSERMTRALATYQRTLVSMYTPYDRWVAGDTGALPLQARAGLELFMGKAKCATCHAPPLFTDGKFHDIGLDPVPKDSGRIRVTGRLEDLGRVRTPTLRNIASTAPYMHDGRFQSLEEVVARYNAGGAPGSTPDSGVGPLGLTGRELYELEAFLGALTDGSPPPASERPAAKRAALPPAPR